MENNENNMNEIENKITNLNKKIEEKNSSTKQLKNEFSEIEKKIEKIPSNDELKKELNEIDKSFDTLKNAINDLEKEKEKLRKEKEAIEKDNKFLLEKFKELVRELPIDKNKLEKEIKEKLVNIPEENTKEKQEPQIDKLFEMVMEKGELKVNEAAEKFNVHEIRIEEWAKVLKKRGLIEIKYPFMKKPVLKKL